MSNILISIIVATYRREKELCTALNSISTQSYSPLEIVIVDDNSDSKWNDTVSGIVNLFANNNPHLSVKYICNTENLGSARSRNVGIDNSIGDYICFLDDDDVYLPDRVMNQVKEMVSKDADYSLTDLKLYTQSDKLVETRHHEYLTNCSTDSLLKLHLMHHLTGTDTMMFSRDYLFNIGCFSPIDIGDEFYLMQKAIEGGGQFVYLPICDVKAYVHTVDSGLSSGIGKINGENELFEHKKKYFDRLDNKTIRYIKMRHYAVLAYAHLRMKCFSKFMSNALLSFISAPIECMKLFLGR